MTPRDFIIANSEKFRAAVENGLDIRMDEDEIFEWMYKYSMNKRSAQDRVCEILGSIFFYGQFNTETQNEKELIELLGELGYLFKDEDELIAKIYNR